ncbi:hypothetical protein NUU61_001126 [Penicillium alfredii]|uniref:Uncharacterized protein n=1 Tax=Penicillium alfredii TaxID=1506179 RepID=A0A9W9KRK1_9EURO|nr:uncharacterized protein NUU61_001126 [Penicillium alfredii]KAJ5115367.1 hypothetical protein NUU61_001126 [Penicillium alfredii]
MSSTDFYYDPSTWPLASPLDSQDSMSFDLLGDPELGSHPFVASDFSPTAQEELGSTLVIVQQDWSNNISEKLPHAYHDYPPSWYEAGLVNTQNKNKRHGYTR